MKHIFFYWLKTNLGFSNKESRGFLLLTPILLLFALTPYFLKTYKTIPTEVFLRKYQIKLDSLARVEATLSYSPQPLFNPLDTLSEVSGSKKSEHLIKLEFPEADSVLLQIVPGIGAGLSGRIIKYREQLGGFYSSNQLAEVYGLKPETINEIWNYFDFTPRITRKIPINETNLNELAQHPYISYGEAKVSTWCLFFCRRFESD